MLQLFARFQAARRETADRFVRSRVLRHAHYKSK